MRVYVFYTLMVLIISVISSGVSLLYQDTPILTQTGELPSSSVHLNYCENHKTAKVTVFKYGSGNDTSCQCSITENIPSTNVRDDYTYTPGIGRHKLYTKATTWNKARKICMEDGAHLAIINSKREESVLLGMLSSGSHQVGFVGLHDMFEEDDWVTIDGKPMHSTGFSEWTKIYGYNPDNHNGRQNCAVLVYAGGLDDVYCTNQHAFFCEIPDTC